jgi:hypothetical protein
MLAPMAGRILPPQTERLGRLKTGSAKIYIRASPAYDILQHS